MGIFQDVSKVSRRKKGKSKVIATLCLPQAIKITEPKR